MIIAISSGAHGLALFDNDFLQPPEGVMEDFSKDAALVTAADCLNDIAPSQGAKHGLNVT